MLINNDLKLIIILTTSSFSDEFHISAPRSVRMYNQSFPSSIIELIWSFIIGEVCWDAHPQENILPKTPFDFEKCLINSKVLLLSRLILKCVIFPSDDPIQQKF